jgi:hypothetical protein
MRVGPDLPDDRAGAPVEAVDVAGQIPDDDALGDQRARRDRPDDRRRPQEPSVPRRQRVDVAALIAHVDAASGHDGVAVTAPRSGTTSGRGACRPWWARASARADSSAIPPGRRCTSAHFGESRLGDHEAREREPEAHTVSGGIACDRAALAGIREGLRAYA